jgi:basic membrane protein A
MISAASSTNPSTKACSTARRSSRRTPGIDFRDLEIQNDAQREQVLRKFAKDGFSADHDAVGFAWATALGKVADEFPNTKFGIIDMVVDKPNVQSIVFKAEEGSFLVGVIAAKRRRPARSASSAAWISRSSRPSNAATRRASNT